MRLIYRIISRLSLALLVVSALWAAVFYFIIIDEINDETDDSLEDYSEQIITRALAGEGLPSTDNGTNNSYHITPVTASYASTNNGIRYSDAMVYLESKSETEPARIMKTIFVDGLDQYYELTVSIPTIEKADLQETIMWWIVFLYLVLLLAIIGINAWILHRSFRPLYALLGWLDNFKMERGVEPLKNRTNVTEFRKLNDAVMRSAMRNVETYQLQKQFIGHASHELQTPLAVCLNRLELLAQDPDLTENQLMQIEKTRQVVDHLIKLNRTLLLLTKIENRQFPDQRPININDLIHKHITEYSSIFSHRNISVTVNEPATLNATMNESLAEVLFGNLLRNAFIHNHDNGSIHIEITDNNILISNTAEGGALDNQQIFQRFYQGAKKEGSTGLGLALAASACKIYDMELGYLFENGRHVFYVGLKN